MGRSNGHEDKEEQMGIRANAGLGPRLHSMNVSADPKRCSQTSQMSRRALSGSQDGTICDYCWNIRIKRDVRGRPASYGRKKRLMSQWTTRKTLDANVICSRNSSRLLVCVSPSLVIRPATTPIYPRPMSVHYTSSLSLATHLILCLLTIFYN